LQLAVAPRTPASRVGAYLTKPIDTRAGGGDQAGRGAGHRIRGARGRGRPDFGAKLINGGPTSAALPACARCT